jgi:hypothetical protein
MTNERQLIDALSDDIAAQFVGTKLPPVVVFESLIECIVAATCCDWFGGPPAPDADNIELYNLSLARLRSDLENALTMFGRMMAEIDGEGVSCDG